MKLEIEIKISVFHLIASEHQGRDVGFVHLQPKMVLELQSPVALLGHPGVALR